MLDLTMGSRIAVKSPRGFFEVDTWLPYKAATEHIALSL